VSASRFEIDSELYFLEDILTSLQASSSLSIAFSASFDALGSIFSFFGFFFTDGCAEFIGSVLILLARSWVGVEDFGSTGDIFLPFHLFLLGGGCSGRHGGVFGRRIL